MRITVAIYEGGVSGRAEIDLGFSAITASGCRWNRHDIVCTRMGSREYSQIAIVHSLLFSWENWFVCSCVSHLRWKWQPLGSSPDS